MMMARHTWLKKQKNRSKIYGLKYGKLLSWASWAYSPHPKKLRICANLVGHPGRRWGCSDPWTPHPAPSLPLVSHSVIQSPMIWTSLHQFSNPDLKHPSTEVSISNHSVTLIAPATRLIGRHTASFILSLFFLLIYLLTCVFHSPRDLPTLCCWRIRKTLTSNVQP